MNSSTDDLLQISIGMHRKGAIEEAVRGYAHVLQSDPTNADTHYYLALALFQLNQIIDANNHAEKAIAFRPQEARAHRLLGEVQARLRRRDEALTSFERAICYSPDMAEAHEGKADVLAEVGRRTEAIASYDRALVLRPDSITAWCNRGATLSDLGRHKEAIDCYDRVIKLKQGFAEAYFNRAGALVKLLLYEEALSSYDQAVLIRPSYTEALNNRGLTLKELGRYEEALASFERASIVQPDFADALYNRANTLKELKRLDEAMAGYDQALAVKPDHPDAFGAAADCAIKLCDWDKRKRFVAELSVRVSNKKSSISPFLVLCYSDDPALQLQCARTYIQKKVPLLPQPIWKGATWRNKKMRIAYLSADFCEHATAHLMAQLFERHDRTRFEIIGVSFGRDDLSGFRKRLISTFDEFDDVRSKNDEEVANLLHDRHVDIAIDLKGYTLHARPAILSFRPAPIQVNYLGYPGTMGATFIDYIISDEIISPIEHERFYAEKIIHLPDCYQVNDSKRQIAERTPTRQEMGLPERGFVFCCFNNNLKIAPPIFDVWMRLLHQVEGSVLWLFRDNESSARNLCKEAHVRGIDPIRLKFAAHLPHNEHLARHCLADLFLDTLPYNAHTTASDALWVGLPVLTSKGGAFAGRVAASLLSAIGLPELITANLEEYQTLALKLARDPVLLAQIKVKLASNRKTWPLFDTDRFTQHIEAAYTNMWEIWQRGEAPRSFRIEPI